MTSNVDWNVFKQTIQHELPNCGIVLKVQGYKVDGEQGIKAQLKILDSGGNSPKSCDYFFVQGVKRLCLEFSDLQAQSQRVQQRNSSIDYSRVDKNSKKVISKLLSFEVEIKNELIGKISDTDFILRYLQSKGATPEFLGHQKGFLIVWHKYGESSVDTSRLLDTILMSIKSELSRRNLQFLNYSDVFILSIEDFQHRYDS